MQFEELQNLMRENGIVGCGGAGFPSYAKLNKNIDTLIINCAECEPLLRLHRQLMEKRTEEILEAVELVRQTLGVKKAYIALKKAYVKAIASLENYISSYPNIEIKHLKEVYPAGDEVVLIYEVTGRIVPPGKLPASVNVIVYNVETIYNVYRALNGRAVTRKYVTIAGEVKSPKTFYAPIGMKISELIELAGGKTIDNPEYLLGGPMMGRLGNENDVVTKTTNAVILLPKDHYVVFRKKVKPSIDLKRAMASCCQCNYCTDLCPRHLLGHPIDPAAFMRNISNQDSHNVDAYINSLYCSGCGLCEMFSCMQGLSPRNLLGVVKGELRKNGVKGNENLKAPLVQNNRELKRVPLSRLRARLDLERYNHSAPMVKEEVMTDVVKIMLSQHVGVPAQAIVKAGDVVKEHSVIAKYIDEKLCVNIHASIDGTIKEVTDKWIVIKK